MKTKDEISSETEAESKVVSFFNNEFRWWPDVYREDFENRFVGYEMRKRREIVLEQMKDLLNPEFNHKVLDCGCGNGGILKNLRDMGGDVLGVDLNYGFLALARESIGSDLAAFQANVERLPFKDNSFAGVCCIGVLSYLPADDAALAEMARVTKPGGKIVLGMPGLVQLNQVLDPYYYLVGGLKYFFRKRTHRRTPAKSFDSCMIRRYRYGRLKKFIDRTPHLKCRTITSVSYGPLTFWRKPIFSPETSINLSSKLQKAAAKPIFSLLGRVANHWVVCLEKTS